MKQLELRRHEVEQLSKDFENRIRAKEVLSMPCAAYVIREVDIQNVVMLVLLLDFFVL